MTAPRLPDGLRALAERLSQAVTLRRRLPARFGGARLIVSPGAGGLRYWRRDLAGVDPWLLRFIDGHVRPGDLVLDVGANVGLASVCAAFKAGPHGRVVALEPDLRTACLLARTAARLDRARYAPIEILAVAAADGSDRVATLGVARRVRAANALLGFGSTQAGGIRSAVRVPALCLDDVSRCFGMPAVVKIDVEGAELLVLRGATRTLERRPILYIETASASWPEVAHLLRSLGYSLTDGDAGAGRALGPDDPAPVNCLATPG